MESATTSTFINPAESEFDGNPSADDYEEIDEAALGHDAGRIEAAKKIRNLKLLLKKDTQIISEAPLPPVHKQSSAIQQFVAPLQNLFTSFSAPAPAAVEPLDFTGSPNVADEPIDAPQCMEFKDHSHPHPDIILVDDKGIAFAAGAVCHAELGDRECCNEELSEVRPVDEEEIMEKLFEEGVNASPSLIESKTHIQADRDEGEAEDKEAWSFHRRNCDDGTDNQKGENGHNTPIESFISKTIIVAIKKNCVHLLSNMYIGYRSSCPFIHCNASEYFSSV